MKDWLRKLLRLVFVIIFLLTAGQAIRLVIDNHNAELKNAQAQSIAGAIATTVPFTEPIPSPTNAPPTKPIPSPTDVPPTEPNPFPTETPSTETVPPETTETIRYPDENMPYLQQLNIRALQEINPDIIGWIYVPNTQINYPVLHTNSNSAYLYTSWDGEYNAAGSIFMEAECSSDLKDFNTIIYGHNMLSGSMFAALHLYRDYSYYQLHPYIYIVTNDEIYRYEVFSAYRANVRTDTYRLRFTSYEKTRALTHYIRSSVWETELMPTSEDLILTLSTCTEFGRYESRWVVQAVLNSKWEK